jgi:hypothetical protein
LERKLVASLWGQERLFWHRSNRRSIRSLVGGFYVSSSFCAASGRVLPFWQLRELWWRSENLQICGRPKARRRLLGRLSSDTRNLAFVAFTAAQANGIAKEDRSLGQGRFTYAVRKGLEGEAMEGDIIEV